MNREYRENTPFRRATDRPWRPAIMIALMVAAAAFIAGRVTGQIGLESVREAEAKPVPSELPHNVQRWHDAANGVTCWQLGEARSQGAGISCLPDQWLATARLDEQP